MTDPSFIIVTILSISFSMFVHGYAGFGFGMISVTLLSFLLFSIERLSVVVTFVGIVATVVLVLLASRGRGKIRWKRALPVMLGNMCGIPLGYLFILRFGDKPLFVVILGVLLLFYMVLGLKGSGIRLHLPDITGFPVGIIAGLIGGAFVSGGPIIVIYLFSQVDDPRDMKATIQAIFFIGMITRIVSVLIGPLGITPDILILFGYAVPFCLAALVTGHLLSKRHSAKLFRTAIYVLVGVLGIVSIVKGVMTLMNPV